jgi:hypothetical protein
MRIIEMPRPHNKELLISESLKEHNKLEDYLSSLSREQMEEPGIVGEWSVKDVLAHLFEWEQMVLRWLVAGKRGENPKVPAEGYKWNQLPALNEEIWLKFKDLPLDEVLSMYKKSYGETMKTIESLSEEVLFTRGLYPWMNKNHLAAYFTSCTSSHYRWALKEIQKGIRSKE